MPASLPPANKFRNLRLREAASLGLVISMRCGLCRRRALYLATDLVIVLGPDHELRDPPWPCSRCRTREYIDIRWRQPAASEIDGLVVRRPVRRVARWIWRSERL